MNNLSLTKLGGQCLIAGGIISFIPFLLQILIGGPPLKTHRYYHPTNSSQSDTLQVKSTHSCKTNRLMLYIG